MKNRLILKSDSTCDLSFLYSFAESNIDFSDIPLILWSNKTVCWEATDYILHLSNFSPNLKKSTLKKYATQFRRIIQFLEYQDIHFDDISDSTLLGDDGLVAFLKNPIHSYNGRSCDNNQTNNTLGQLFNILFYLQSTGHISQQSITDDPSHLAKVNVRRKKFRPKKSRSSQNYYDHPARLSTKSPKKKHAISEFAINTLIMAIHNYTNNAFIRTRWHLLIQLLELTGARESELALLTVNSVENAIAEYKRRSSEEDFKPRLELTTTKGSNNGEKRLVPISTTVLKDAETYLKLHRYKAIQRSLIHGDIEKDHGFFLVTEIGMPLKSKRIYEHFREVRLSTNLLSGDASPHLFRHRFISIQVKMRLKDFLDGRHNLGKDIETAVIKKVKRLTGHVSDSALWGYVDDAMEELEIFEEIERKILRFSENSAISRKAHEILAKANNSNSTEQKADSMNELIDIVYSNIPYLEQSS